eukprot:scaffold155220_cov45-Attheya_sp.AAC.1
MEWLTVATMADVVRPPPEPKPGPAAVNVKASATNARRFHTAVCDKFVSWHNCAGSRDSKACGV